ncbi:UPF0193 protein EVG1 [Poecilia reticulata]|uniref:Chromosome LG1 open reading frame, human C22orf23 n=1 Tax=Poecilia reticulata TaxID=8081 RepID=A0A3P9MTQ1_POERE|nr:PREDICTED: UPF0193 protein EVG1 [Poecilia reticulata]XP_008407118.1 PREDICTED: UPF0193 protein EVG1 [Poecilia reticulata]
MENVFIGAGGGGLWNNPRHPRYNKEAEELKKLRKDEVDIINIKRKESIRSTTPLSTSASEKSTASKSDHQCKPRRTAKRTAEACRAGKSYEREMFHPGPFRDMDDEKRRLQNFMATGRYEDPGMSIKTKKAERCKPEEAQKPDPYEEVLNEIEERKQFLEDMAALGQDQDSFIVKSQIQEKLHELEALEKDRKSKEKTDK